MYKHFRAFSLAEALITLLIIALVALLTVPAITKKRKNLDVNGLHGKWACKYINGDLYSVKLSNIDEEIPDDDDKGWTKGCVLPTVAKSVKYFWVELYGGGGGASTADVVPWVEDTKTDSYNVYGGNDYVYDVPETTEYEVYFLPNSNAGNLSVKDADSYYIASDDSLKNCTECIMSGTPWAFCKKQGNKNMQYRLYSTCQKITQTCESGDNLDYDSQQWCLGDGYSEGFYCGNSLQDFPPHNYTTRSQVLNECNANKGNCMNSSFGSNVVYSDENACIWLGSLPRENSGIHTKAIMGELVLNKGEQIIFETDDSGAENHSEQKVGNYTFNAHNDAPAVNIKLKKASGSEEIIAKYPVIKTPTVSINADDGGNKWQYDVECIEGYNNTYFEGCNSTPQTKNSYYIKSYPVESPTIADSYKPFLSTIHYSSTNYYWSYIFTRKTHTFMSYSGKSGENGRYTAQLVPAGNYDFVVGEGGKGGEGLFAMAEDALTLNTSISGGNGEKTTFGEYFAEGGKGAGQKDFDNKFVTVDDDDKKKPIAGVGGKGENNVTYKGDEPPQRNFSLPIERDQAPNGRWVVNDGANGGSGMVVVSW